MAGKIKRRKTAQKEAGNRGIQPNQTVKAEPEEAEQQARVAVHQRTFLDAISSTGNIARAAKAAGLGRRNHYRWNEEDPTYPQRFQDSLADYCDKLAAEADRRAVEGTDRPVFYNGVQCGAIRDYSDSLLALRLKKFDKSHRERFESTVRVEQSFDSASLQKIVATPEGRELVRELAERMAGAMKDG